MNFGYEIVRLWERPAEELLAADLGVTPLAMLGRLPENVPLEDGLAAVARRLAELARMPRRPGDNRSSQLGKELLDLLKRYRCLQGTQ